MSVFATIFEIIMVICFGASWPMNIIRAYKSKTTKGTSLFFLLLIEVGYISGIVSKVFMILGSGLSWLGYVALSFYILNLLMVFLGILIYFRNLKFDKARNL